MISIQEAIKIVEDASLPTGQTETKKLEFAAGQVLFDDVVSPIDMPPFRQSAMDGYAVNIHEGEIYDLVGEIKAGEGKQHILKKGEAVRIFTGAAVPDSANSVVIQEKVLAGENTIRVEAPPNPEANIRPLGEQVMKGATALEKGNLLTPAAIGLLTSLGITEVSTFKKPSVAIITTGSELIEAGQPAQHGQIFESNSGMLSSALRELGYKDLSIHKIRDDFKKTIATLLNAIDENDVLIITGGISVGDYDFVGRALRELEVEELFYWVKQKPGKPFYFGRRNHTLVFALPGNPAAALSCFYIYVYMALERLSGNLNFQLLKTMEESASEFSKKGDRPQILKANYKNEKVTLLDGQSSSMLQTFALANALVFLPEEVTRITIGDLVEVIHLPK